LSQGFGVRVLFMGTPDYAWAILEELLKDSEIEVVGVFTQPDKPVGRKKILTPPFVKKRLIEDGFDVDIFQPKSLKDDSVIDSIRGLKPDFIVVAAYGQILPKAVLDIAPCINLHASLLPRYRGASPIQSSLLNRDKFTGVTAMKMDVGLDTGDILAYSFVKIKEDMVVGELFDELSFSASKLCLDVLKKFDDIKPLKQFDCDSSYAKKIKREDGEVDLVDSEELFTKYRAYTPWPGIFLKSGLKLLDIKPSDLKSSEKKGEILRIEEDFITLSCEKGALDIYRVQPKSKRQMSAKEYIVGKRLKVGDTFF